MQVGDKKTEKISFGDSQSITATGTVVYIHPKRAFYIVEFELPGGSVRESYYFPDRRGDK